MTNLAIRNRRSAIGAAIIVAAMLGLGYASVPLYRLFCQVTGFQGTTQRASAADLPKTVASRMVRVRFDSNTAPSLNWTFKPERETDDIAIGARDMAFFTAKNNADHEITGTATFNVTPETAGKYFTKIQCFCFTQQTLKAGEQVRMPVIFFVDPKILTDPDAKDIQEITLSYTFFPVDPAKAGS